MPNDVLRVADLRAAVTLALDTFEAEHGHEVQILHDHYWHLPVEASFDLSREPSELTVGLVSTDLDEIRQFLSTRPDDAEPAWHTLANIIGLLRLLQHEALP